MKKLLLSALAFTVLATSCSKKGDDKPSNTISVDGTNYTVGAGGFTVNGSSVGTAGTNGSNVASVYYSFSGSTAPSAGTYKVVSSMFPNAGEVGISLITMIGGANKTFSADGTGGVNATVTVNSGKLTIDVPEFSCTQMTGGTAKATVKVQKITQP